MAEINRNQLRDMKQWLWLEYAIAKHFAERAETYLNPDFLVLPNGKSLKWK